MGLVDRIDDFGKPAWIGLMVLGFVLFWPVGLAILAYLIWSGRMGCWKHGGAGRWYHGDAHAMRAQRRRWRDGRGGSSGNVAFDEYREETLRRLEEEQDEFHGFLERLRHAKDKAEFDQFMAERRQRPQEPMPQPEG